MRSSGRGTLGLVALLLAVPAATHADEPEVWTTVSARKHGQTFGPFPAVAGAAYLMPGVVSCEGWTDVVETYSSGMTEFSGHTAAYVRKKGDGCELFVLKHRMTVKPPIDLEHDPRVRRLPAEGPEPEDE